MSQKRFYFKELFSVLTPHKATHTIYFYVHRFYYKKIKRLDFHPFNSFLSMLHQYSDEHPIFVQP